MAKPKDDTKVSSIFQAALELVLETGYAGLKMSAVAKKAKVATGTIYTYFEHKEDLINKLFRELKSSKMREIFRDYDPELPFYNGFRLLWYNYLYAGLKEPERSLFIDQYQHSDFLDDRSKAMRIAAYEPLYAFLEQAQQAQLIKNIPVKVMAAQLMGGVNGVAKLYFGQAEAITPEIVDQCFEMAWRSIRK